ncbi:reverse transcriptase [Gossypium australe]|uniref:Reverse transcriptase n=1 Tax=Gossypium australe TaxID=47621 RepID=A0A5B6VFJ8_9ROSI|nr:reverse transcriptase [Gossypium australe]
MDTSLINKTNIVLIPKISNPSNITQFRPISLCNVLYKLMAKVIANRLRIVMDKCIDLTQSAFVPKRLISDNVLLAYELRHTLKHKRGEKGFMAVKLDISKAYDRVEWNFVEEVIKKLRFDWEWVASLMKCVKTVSYSVFLNGLFSLMRLEMQGKTIRGFKASRSGPQVSHLLFADDCVLFGEATERGANSLKQILQEYGICSGQSVNYSKSTIFFSTNTQEEIKRIITRVLGVRSSNDPERYLGFPNLVGRKKKSSFQNLKDRLQQRIDNWSIKYLSQGGKVVFIKAVLQYIPTYSMDCFLVPKSLCADLEGIIAKFCWKKGIHWCAWKDICSLKEAGGWRLINYPNSLLARVSKAKYYPNLNFLNAPLGNLHSLTWKSVWSTKGLLEKGLCWRVGKGDRISVWIDLWVLGNEEDKIQNQSSNENTELVSDLIDEENRTWKTELIILLEKSCRSFWRSQSTMISKLKRVVVEDRCPRCHQNEEAIDHVLRQCPTMIEV